MNNKKEEVAVVKTLRERLGLKEQVEEQIQIVRLAWVEGQIDVLSRSTEALKMMLWNKFPKDKQIEYNQIIYNPIKVKDIYTKEDNFEISRCGELDFDRERELSTTVDNLNKTQFFAVIGKKMDLFMKVVDLIGVGFEQTDSGFLSHDKKKPISWAGRYNKEFTTDYLLKNVTGLPR